MSQTQYEHFKGKSVAEHLREARLRGSAASSETHGLELPGQFMSGMDSAKETATLFLLIWAATLPMEISLSSLLLLSGCFAVGWILWKTGRSALLGWSRLNRLHRVIEEERWEIEHHREQEKEELREMYEVKGFSGELLDEVVEVLMADDNRLLRVMLEEELGLSLEAYEHPLKQAAGALVGTGIISALSLLAFFVWPLFGVLITSTISIAVAAALVAGREKRSKLKTAVWNCALALFATAFTYFLVELFV